MKNQKKNRRAARLLAALLSAVMLVSLSVPLAGAKVTQAQIDKLKTDSQSLGTRRKELEDKIKGLKEDRTKALEQKILLDEKVANTAARIRNTEEQISEYGALIAEKEMELSDAQDREEEQYELFCRRVRAMEKRGTVSYWSVLFKAESFTDLLGRLDFINEIMDSDQRVIDDLQALQVEIEDKKTELEGSKAEAEAARADLLVLKAEQDKDRQEAIDLVNEIEGNKAENEETLRKIAREEASVQANIVKLSKELAAQQAAANGGKPSNAALGGYIWPVSSHYITSPFGGRNTGIKGASTNHKGIDIGRVGYTTAVQAAKAGTVIVAQRSSSYGNYVVVSHGSGNTTLYAHMSSLKVSVGKYVNQGDTVGITGSTGISSGPHLHFEITENGVRVDPQKYLK